MRDFKKISAEKISAAAQGIDGTVNGLARVLDAPVFSADDHTAYTAILRDLRRSVSALHALGIKLDVVGANFPLGCIISSPPSITERLELAQLLANAEVADLLALEASGKKTPKISATPAPASKLTTTTAKPATKSPPRPPCTLPDGTLL